MNIASIARNIQKQYDLILINAPYLDGHPDRKMIASSARYAFVFANEPAQADRLAKLCAASRCKILGCYKMQKNGIPSASGSAQ
jgi:Mrp family chromosome partitioning ATPase